MITFVTGGPWWFGSITSWKEIPETGISFRVSSPLGPLPLKVAGGAATGVGLTSGAATATAGVALLLLLLLPVVSSSEAEADDDVRGSGELDRLAWFGSCWVLLPLVVFLTGGGVACLRIGPEVPLECGAAAAAGGSTTLIGFLADSLPLVVLASVDDDPLICGGCCCG